MTSAVAATVRPVTRRLSWADATSDVRAALLGFAIVTPVAALNGGYFPTSWGWTSLALAWLAVVALLVRPLVRLGPLELTAAGMLGAFALWTAVSAAWSTDAGDNALSFERTLVYATGLAAALVVVRSGSYRALLAGVWASATAVCGYALLTRLYPDRFHVTVAIAGNRLAQPLGYWNGLGLFAAVGLLLALGLAAYGRHRLVRPAAAASLVPLVLTLYFTFSRGAWLALGIGIAVAIAVDPRRLQFIVALLATVPWAALAVARASHAKALTTLGALNPAAGEQGRSVAFAALGLAAGAAATAVLLVRAERTARVPPPAQRLFATALVAVLAVTLLGIFGKYGSPPTLARKGWHAFNAPPVPVTDLNARLFSFSGSWRVDLWKVALEDYGAHPVLGSGAGTYHQAWLERRTVPSEIVNAHSVYLETLAELGPVGLVLLLVALAAPLVAAAKARTRRLVPAATAAYAAFLVHAAVDWDWQLPAVTLAALFCGAALLAAARRDARVQAISGWPRIAAVASLLAIAVVSALTLVGNRAAASSANATPSERFAAAEHDARRAAAWQPWSSRPWQLLGEAQLQQGELAAARASFRRAIAKDPHDWQLWLELAFASGGAARHEAALHALRLNPLSSEIAQVRPALGLGKATR